MKKSFVKKYVLVLLILILITMISCKRIEYFDNYMDSIRGEDYVEKENKDPKDKMYVKLSDIILNEPAVYKNDILIIKKHTDLNNESVILDAGCGTGRNILDILRLYPDVKIEGVDISKNMIIQSRINNPGSNLLCASLTDHSLYKRESLTHILCTRMTLNENSLKDIGKILVNFNRWLKKGGYLVMNIMDPNKLDPGPRAFSQYYKSDNNVKHSLTYFEGFTHDAWWEKVEDDFYRYCEKIMFSNKNFIIRTTKYWLPPVNKILEYITNNGFKIKEIIDIDKFDRDNMSIYIFRK
jgi:ubiquinone/menaquinone biosynthesis C-methylase UbiE